MIRFQNVTKVYPPNSVALDGVTFDIEKGEFVSIVGRSGAGKTTLLRILLAEEAPSRGRVFFSKEEIHKIKRSHLPQLRRLIGFVFQDYKLLHDRTAFENVAYALQVLGMSDEIIARDVPQVLDLVGLTGKIYNFPHELSGGEKQRVAIARAIVVRPQVLVADEPTGNLDPYHTKEIIRLLIRINELGTTVILSSHGKDIINALGKRVITLDGGKVVGDEQKGKFIL